mmetsp:Transcript_939/g.2806  ORF Transcript_939/g.2806 Transcript_939/m.2806 type:complete len:408 (+) Transcript_939:1102-2325(+)
MTLVCRRDERIAERPVVDLLPIHERGLWLHDYVRHPLALDETLGGDVETEAAPLWRQEACRAGENPGVGYHHEEDASRHRRVVRLELICLDFAARGRVPYGRQRRGALTVDREARALQAQAEGDSVRRDTVRAARACTGVGDGHVVEFTRGPTDVDTNEAPHQPLLVVSRLEEGLIRCLKDVALHGVHLPRLHHGDAEKPVVEKVTALEEGGMPTVGLHVLPALRIGVIAFLVIPAKKGDLHAHVDAEALRAPVTLRRIGARELARYALERDLLAHVEHPVCSFLPLLGKRRVKLCAFLTHLLALLEFPNLVGGPVKELLGHGRGHEGLAAVAEDRLLVEPAAQRHGAARRCVLVREAVATKDDHRARLNLHLHGRNLLVPERLQLERAAGRAKEEQGHERGLHQLL